MIRSSSFIPYSRAASKKNDAKGVADHLRGPGGLSSILPTVARLVAIQKDCTDALPGLFESCQVLNLADSELTIAIPNAAFASKLKQRVPKLQEHLHKRGWQVSSIRLKVQVVQKVDRPVVHRSLSLSSSAVRAFAELQDSLEKSPRNSGLHEALQAMLARHRNPK